jgi:hypothetical protein
LDATAYYAQNSEIFSSVVNELDRNDASSTSMFQEIFNNPRELKVLKTDLAYIHGNLFSLVVYNKVGRDHKFAVRKNQRHSTDQKKYPTTRKLMQ